MRLDRVFIDGFKNLKDFEVVFDPKPLTTVLIGQNGAGKSNLIEVITDVFRYVDLNSTPPRYRYEIDYQIGGASVRFSNLSGKAQIAIDGKVVARAVFEKKRADVFPDLVFGYYSGGSRRLERLFDGHQRNYYDAIKINDNAKECKAALTERHLFYCRPIHGTFALLSFFAFPDPIIAQFLKEKLGLVAFHSALAHFREPWFAKTRPKSERKASNLWGAKGPAGICGRQLRDAAFHPLALEDRPIDDYRDKGEREAQFAGFLRNAKALKTFAKAYKNEREMFYALEAVDISDLFRELHVWVTRVNDTSGDIGFTDLSDGERQLLMVLGLIRLSRGKHSLFLLDEPDTHLNPHWQLTYLELIRQWAGVAADDANCQMIMSSHNPLTIASLERSEVRVMSVNEKGHVSAREPSVDPKGLGFAGVLTDVFGMASALDNPTQELIDERNEIARRKKPSKKELSRLEKLNVDLRQLGIMYEGRDKLFSLFLRKLDEVELAGIDPLTPEEMKNREEEAREIVEELLEPK